LIWQVTGPFTAAVNGERRRRGDVLTGMRLGTGNRELSQTMIGVLDDEKGRV
jgi:hypothetical protein